MKQYTYKGMLISVAVLVASTAIPARGDDTPMVVSLPQQQQANGVTYITGGIGDEERNALESMKPNYNLHVTSAGSKAGEFKGNTNVAIINHEGEEMVNTNVGPLFMAKLPAGSYTVVAQNQQRQIRKNVNVGASKSTDVGFYW